MAPKGTFEELLELCTQNLLSDRAYSGREFVIRKGRNICSQAGARLIVMTIPETTQLTQAGLEGLVSLAPDPKAFDPDFPDQRIR